MPSIGKRASFVADLAGAYHFVGSGGGGGGGYGLTLKEGVNFSPLYLLGLLNSRLLDWAVKLSNSRFGQGYYSFNRQYIAPLPIRAPDPSVAGDRADHERMVAMVERMMALQGRLMTAKDAPGEKLIRQQIAALDRQIDRLVYQLYGLTDAEVAIVEADVAR